jgi:hypothetical protein
MSKKNSSDAIESLDSSTGNPTTLLRTNQVENIIAQLRVVIDERDKNFADAKSLILELARHLDETRQCEETQICRKIKEMLNDKINEGKITGKWIEECLPQEYKRKYAKSELSSLLRNAKKVGKILVDNEGNAVGSGKAPLPLSISIDDRFTPSENNNNQFQDKSDLLPFTIFVPYNDIWQYIMHLVAEDRREDKICFKGVLQKSTYKVISITIKETPQSENEL